MAAQSVDKADERLPVFALITRRAILGDEAGRPGGVVQLLGRSQFRQEIDDPRLIPVVELPKGVEQAQPAQNVVGFVARQFVAAEAIEIQPAARGFRVARAFQRGVDGREADGVPFVQELADDGLLVRRQRFGALAGAPTQVGQRLFDTEALKRWLRPWRARQGRLQRAATGQVGGRFERALMEDCLAEDRPERPALVFAVQDRMESGLSRPEAFEFFFDVAAQGV